MPTIDGLGRVSLDGKVLGEYTFKHNWYFLGGDNVLNSRDSRYFGLVPEEYIVGIVIQ
ncbi:MAG: S26 family signal peptidase [Bacteroidales bacterium]|nr:S26 family signal peptidase [Bacteroidales bacterium]